MTKSHPFRLSVLSGALLLLSGLSLSTTDNAHAAVSSTPDKFGRMFLLPPFALATDSVRSSLLEVGKANGILDAKDNLAAGPISLITDLSLSTNNRNSTSTSAGTTFAGQFFDHDVTFDTTSRLGRTTSPLLSPNARTPDFDLDSVYGEGPVGSPQLYEPSDRTKLRVENGGQFEDLPRDPVTGSAVLGDPRNDEHIILAGFHAAFLLFHNKAVDQVRSENPGIADDDAFNKARTLTTYHYQWMILHEFLPAFVGQGMVDDILNNGRRFYRPASGQAFIPVEFQMVYRFGHSMVRPSYRANLAGDNNNAFFGMIFDPAGQGSADPIDLRGGVRAPRRFVGWQTFFDFGDGEVKPNKRIDTKISTALFNLPLATIPTGAPPTSLMQRNLLRHLTWSLPAGQTIARAMGMQPLAPANFEDIAQIRRSFGTSTPLLFYVLREAEVENDGVRLGRVGGRIVGEVFIGLLQSDPKSYLNAQPDFRPTLPTRAGHPDGFRMIDFLTFAGVDPISRGQ